MRNPSLSSWAPAGGDGRNAALGFCCDLSAGNSPWGHSISLWDLDKCMSWFLYSFTKMHFYFYFPGTSITAPSDRGIKGNIWTESAAGRTPVSPALPMLLLRSGLYLQVMDLPSGLGGCRWNTQEGTTQNWWKSSPSIIPTLQSSVWLQMWWVKSTSEGFPFIPWGDALGTIALSPALTGISWLAGNNSL